MKMLTRQMVSLTAELERMPKRRIWNMIQGLSAVVQEMLEPDGTPKLGRNEAIQISDRQGGERKPAELPKGLLLDQHALGVRVTADDGRHYRRVGHAVPGDTANPQLWVQHNGVILAIRHVPTG